MSETLRDQVAAPVLLTAREVSDLTRISVSTLHDYAVRREHGLPADGPPHLRLGPRRRRWDREDVLTWIRASRVS
ncbi:helix-turn-helix transcriptional regulator [Gordonia sp. DT218]|uniref:helix-turn-helix transcriptional regulator n=1 Tax=Gordonia sp. DT218 TaxID=3416659 RepID=UPI003CF3776F